MRGLLLALLAATGCGRLEFDPRIDAHVPQDADTFDAPRGMAGVDTDGDGVNDDVDNCISMPNPGQHDEDADGYGDVCDNCPSIANTSQANVGEINAGAQADSVGDACDPRPTKSGESILFFESFEGSALTSGWTTVGAAWTVTNDAVVQDGLVTDARLQAATTGSNYLVETKLDVTGFDTGNTNAGIVYRMASDSGWLCAVFRNDATTPIDSALALWSIQNGAGNLERNSVQLGEVKAGNTYRLLAGGYGTNLYCAIDSLQSGPSAPYVNNKNPAGVSGLRANAMTGAYSYFVVYGLGGPI